MIYKIVNKETKEQYEVDLRSKGENAIVCPSCSQDRKKKNVKCFNFNVEKQVGHCGHCGMSAFLKTDKPMLKKDYVKPLPRLEKLRPEVIAWFEKERKISNNTLLRFGITEAVEWMPQFEKEVPVICFNYYRGEELINIKFRGAKKSFRLAKDAELIFYNLNATELEKEIIIVEGEMDVLALYEAGFYNVISVPNGATKGTQKLEYLDNCIDSFEHIETVILATDADEPGFNLREELARRIGKDKCKRIEFPEGCKDANDVLVKSTIENLRQVIESATEWPIEGVLTMEDMIEDVWHYYEHGYPEGVKMQITGFDEHLSFMAGQLTMVTGAPSSGKSEFLDLIVANSLKHYQWPWAICSFENQPSSLHVTKIMEKLTGKSFAQRSDGTKRLSKQEFFDSAETINRHVNFINLRSIDLSLTGILEKVKELVKRKGVKAVIIDPWNYIEHKQNKGQTETQYINECLSEIKSACISLGIHIFLVAHPVKLKKENGKYEVATLYHINGSSHFYNKTDNGLSIHRDRQTGIVDVHIQKVRYSWLGREGFCSFSYDTETRQYIPLIETSSTQFPVNNWKPVNGTHNDF